VLVFGEAICAFRSSHTIATFLAIVVFVIVAKVVIVVAHPLHSLVRRHVGANVGSSGSLEEQLKN